MGILATDLIEACGGNPPETLSTYSDTDDYVFPDDWLFSKFDVTFDQNILPYDHINRVTAHLTATDAQLDQAKYLLSQSHWSLSDGSPSTLNVFNRGEPDRWLIESSLLKGPNVSLGTTNLSWDYSDPLGNEGSANGNLRVCRSGLMDASGFSETWEVGQSSSVINFETHEIIGQVTIRVEEDDSGWIIDSTGRGFDGRGYGASLILSNGTVYFAAGDSRKKRNYLSAPISPGDHSITFATGSSHPYALLFVDGILIDQGSTEYTWNLFYRHDMTAQVGRAGYQALAHPDAESTGDFTGTILTAPTIVRQEHQRLWRGVGDLSLYASSTSLSENKALFDCFPSGSGGPSLYEYRYNFTGQDDNWDTDWTWSSKLAHDYVMPGSYSWRIAVRDGWGGYAEDMGTVSVSYF
jgi:hypothetical protein